MTSAYKSYEIPINFKGWKEFKISFKQLEDSYGGDLKKLSGMSFYANGWGNIPNEKTELYFDKILFTKYNYEFNERENDITEDNYIKALNKFTFGILGSGSILKGTDQNIIKRLKSNVNIAIKTREKLNKAGLPFDYDMTASLGMYSIYSKVNEMATGYAIEGGELYKNKELLGDIIYCLDYMHNNYYTKRYPKIFTGLDN